MTSNIRTVVKSLRDLQTWLKENPTVGGRTVETTWRLTAGLDQEIGLPHHDPKTDGDLPPMLDVLAEVDAVITTPSTVYLESVINRIADGDFGLPQHARVCASGVDDQCRESARSSDQ